jgi:hypothetical protein
MAWRGSCWQLIMAGRKISTNCAEVADVMAEDYGKKACHKKFHANFLSLSLFLPRFLFSVSLPSNSASDLSLKAKST